MATAGPLDCATPATLNLHAPRGGQTSPPHAAWQALSRGQGRGAHSTSVPSPCIWRYTSPSGDSRGTPCRLSQVEKCELWSSHNRPCTPEAAPAWEGHLLQAAACCERADTCSPSKAQLRCASLTLRSRLIIVRGEPTCLACAADGRPEQQEDDPGSSGTRVHFSTRFSSAQARRSTAAFLANHLQHATSCSIGAAGVRSCAVVPQEGNSTPLWCQASFCREV